ncbi:MAG: AraC family transcriptional regulator [Bacteroidales bacterium]|nr:AraC family transcriptional regulator [Bacteroidales bacterium]
MTYNDFCALNGNPAPEPISLIPGCKFPGGEFSPEFTLIVYSSFGNASLLIDGKNGVFKRRSMSMWRPGQKIRIEPESGFTAKVLLFREDTEKEMNLNNLYLTQFVMNDYPVIRITSRYTDSVNVFFDAIDRVMQFEANPYKQECLLSLMRAFFYSTGYYIFRSLKFYGNELFKIYRDTPRSEKSIVNRFVRLVEDNSLSRHNLSFYAKELDYNPKYLSALIKRETGHSGQNIIDQYITLTAMTNLSYGHKSVKEISDQMGFPSQSDFGKFFKRMTGYSPLAYRKTRTHRMMTL